MLQYLGRLLARSPHRPVQVRYLDKAESEAVWREGRLIAVDNMGACFELHEGDAITAICLPWGTIGAIRIVTGVLQPQAVQVETDLPDDSRDSENEKPPEHGPLRRERVTL